MITRLSFINTLVSSPYVIVLCFSNLGSTTPATRTGETACCPEGTARPAEVPAWPDPVLTATAPAATCRTEATENSRGGPELAGEGQWQLCSLQNSIQSDIVRKVCGRCTPSIKWWQMTTVDLLLQMDMNGQPLHPYTDHQIGSRSLPNSSSEMCLRSHEEHVENQSNMRKHSSMTRLSRDSLDGEGVVFHVSPRRNVDSCVQTDDEDGEERYILYCSYVYHCLCMWCIGSVQNI